MSRLLVNPDAPEAWAIELQPGTLSAYDYMLKPVRGGELLAGIARRLAG